MHFKSKPMYVKLKERMITEGWITLLSLIWISIKIYYSPQEYNKPNRKFKLITNAVCYIKVILFFDYSTKLSNFLYHWKKKESFDNEEEKQNGSGSLWSSCKYELQIFFVMTSFNITQETTTKILSSIYLFLFAVFSASWKLLIFNWIFNIQWSIYYQLNEMYMYNHSD